MGSNVARLAFLGRKRLEAAGLAGLKVPRLRADMCKSCACKPNTVPNGCLPTQLDFLKSVSEGKGFFCHAPHDGRICAGWVSVRAEIVANPLPKQALALLAKWKYSPPNEIGDNT